MIILILSVLLNYGGFPPRTLPIAQMISLKLTEKYNNGGILYGVQIGTNVCMIK